MNLSEVIKNLSAKEKKLALRVLVENPTLSVVTQTRTGSICAYLPKTGYHFDSLTKNWLNWGSASMLIQPNEVLLATDQETTILTRDEVLELLKVEEYTLDNLPKKGWFVELPDDKNSLDLDKLNKALKCRNSFYYVSGEKVCKYCYVDSYCSSFTDDFESVKNFKNVTHLFKKKEEESMDLTTTKSQSVASRDDYAKIDVVWPIIDGGKKYDKAEMPERFSNGDMILVNRDYIATVIGYDDEKLVVKIDGDNEYSTCELKSVTPLKEIKVKIWHYAIYEFDDKSSITQLCEFKADVEEIITSKIGVKKVTYLTYEQS